MLTIFVVVGLTFLRVTPSLKKFTDVLPFFFLSVFFFPPPLPLLRKTEILALNCQPRIESKCELKLVIGTPRQELLNYLGFYLYGIGLKHILIIYQNCAFLLYFTGSF